MYVNLHTLPRDMAMFTLFVGLPGQPDLEEYDQVAAAREPEHRYLAGVVIEAARDALLDLYGRKVEVRVVANQSTGEVVFQSEWSGFRPIPVDLSRFPNVPGREDWPDPYSALIDLMHEVSDGLSDGSYLDYILQEG